MNSPSGWKGNVWTRPKRFVVDRIGARQRRAARRDAGPELRLGLAWGQQSQQLVLGLSTPRRRRPGRRPGRQVDRRRNAQAPQRTVPARQHADHRVAMTIQYQRPPDGVRVVRQPAFPEGVRHDRRVARLADALGREHASLRRLDAQRSEVVRTHRLAVYPHRFVAGLPGELFDPIAEAGHARRRLAQVAQIQPGDPIAIADPEADQRCRTGGAHRLQDDRVHHAEERRAETGADAQRQAGDDEQRLAAHQAATGVAQILDRAFESGRHPDVVRRLARQGRVPHAEAGRTPRVLGRQAGVDLVLLGKRAMPGDLVSEVLLAPPAMPQIREPSKQPHGASFRPSRSYAGRAGWR